MDKHYCSLIWKSHKSEEIKARYKILILLAAYLTNPHVASDSVEDRSLDLT